MTVYGILVVKVESEVAVVVLTDQTVSVVFKVVLNVETAVVVFHSMVVLITQTGAGG